MLLTHRNPQSLKILKHPLSTGIPVVRSPYPLQKTFPTTTTKKKMKEMNQKKKKNRKKKKKTMKKKKKKKITKSDARTR